MYSVKKYLKTLNIRSILLHTLVWVALIGLPYLFHPPSEQKLDASGLPLSFFPLTNILHAMLFYLNAYWVQPRLFNKGRRWQYVITMLMLIGIFFYLKILLLRFGFFSVPLQSSQIPVLFFPTVMFVLISMVYRMVVDKINAENEQLKTELKFLRSQISPHFLFNILNNLVAMARKKSDQLEPSLIKLSGLMRYMQQQSGDQQISLAKEIEYLKSYVELQNIRYSDDVSVRMHLPQQINTHMIEPMLLIPFVENAFKHGVGIIKNPRIDVSLSVDGDTLFFEVMNRFNEEDKQKDSRSGIGLSNVKKRLDILYPGRHQLEISQLENIFKVNLKLVLV